MKVKERALKTVYSWEEYVEQQENKAIEFGPVMMTVNMEYVKPEHQLFYNIIFSCYLETIQDPTPYH